MAECGCSSRPAFVGIDDGGAPIGPGAHKDGINTLRLYPDRCNGCGRCQQVCPHGVFEVKEGKAGLVNENECMECGACMMNCPQNAIAVDSGVGCASAMIKGALTGKEPSCGDDCCK